MSGKKPKLPFSKSGFKSDMGITVNAAPQPLLTALQNNFYVMMIAQILFLPVARHIQGVK
jgi:hypothetical protein